MSQDVIAHKISPGQAEEPLSLQPWSIESYADNLMEELFEDVDQILDGGTASSAEFVTPDYVSIQPLSMPKLMLPPGGTDPAGWLIPHQESQLGLSGSQETPAKEHHSGSLLDKVLLTIACTSLLLTGLLGLASQGKLNWVPFIANLNLHQSLVPSTPSAPDPQLALGEQFVSYMQRSLNLIEQSATAPQTTPAMTALGVKPVPTASSASNLPALPTVPVPTSGAANRPSTVLERVYIPIYQPTQPAYNLPNQLLPSSGMPSPGNNASSTIGVPAAPPVAVAPPALPANHTLVGIMELGQRSAALFEVNGTAQRVAIGEGIGTSGWTLVKVTSQEAVIRRNGEVRSIFIGQKF